MKKKVALITGASTGIGRELSLIHAKTGGDLIIVARSRDKLEDLKRKIEREYKVEVYVIVKDLSKSEGPREVYDSVKEMGIEVDYLINNAGFGGMGRFHERDWEIDLSMIQLNIVALTALTRFFLTDMIESNEGRILNVSSTASLIPGPLQAVYYATKAYVTSFTNAIAQEVRRTGVTVTNLMPGATETEFGRISGMDKTSIFKKTADAYKVASDGYIGMLEGRLNIVSGLTLSQKILLRISTVLPKAIVLKTIYKMQDTGK